MKSPKLRDNKNRINNGTYDLGIWNKRVNIAKDNYEPLRSCILVRNPSTLEFRIYEHELHRFITKAFVWERNKNDNFIGRDTENKHVFTRQHHGSQFTILYDGPDFLVRFKVKKSPVFDFNETLRQIGFDNRWVTIHE